MRYVSSKLEVSTALLLRENRRHGKDGQTDRQTDGRGVTRNATRIIILLRVSLRLTLTLRRPSLLPYGYSYKASCARAGLSRHL